MNNGSPAIKLDFANNEQPSITIQSAKNPPAREYANGYQQQPPLPPRPAPPQPTAAPAPAPAPVPAVSRRPHPLLWITLGISILALVLGVPKGSLPTLTGRHKALRAQEVLVQERLSLLSHLSTFLPPPLAALLGPDLADARSSLDLVRLGTGLQLWNVDGNKDTDGVYWTLEDLGNGASVVRSNANGNSREVWVLRDGNSEVSPAVTALAAALHAREKLQRELEAARAARCECPEPEATISEKSAKELEIEEREAAILAREREYELEKMRKEDRAAWEKEVEAREAEREATEKEEAARERRRQHEREERQREVDERRRMRERLEEMEERERDVVRREKWVVDAIRKLSDKARENANELTMEDRITERLKVYKRQLAELHAAED